MWHLLRVWKGERQGLKRFHANHDSYGGRIYLSEKLYSVSIAMGISIPPGIFGLS